MNEKLLLKISVIILSIMSTIFMPLANRQSTWMIFLILIAVSLLFVVVQNKVIVSIKKNLICKISFFWIIFYSVYFIHTIFTKGTEGIRIYYFSSIIWLILGILLYSYSLKDKNEKGLSFIIYCSIFLLFYFFTRSLYLSFSHFSSVAEELKNTIPYFLMYLSIPVLLINNRNKKMILLGAITFFILLSTKRGPLLLMIIAGGITYFLTSKKNIFFKISTISFIVILGVLIGILVLPDITDKFVNRFDFSDLESDEGLDNLTSTRSVIWTILYTYWINSNINTQIWGFGLNAVPEHLEMLTYHNLRIFAHSDWVDTMFNLGWVGLSLFFLYHIILIREIVLAIKNDNKYGKYMLYGYLMFLFSNFFTGALVSFSTTWFSIFFFYFAAKTQQKYVFNNHTPV